MRRLPPDALALRRALRRGDCLIRCQGIGWRLLKADAYVPVEAVDALRCPGGQMVFPFVDEGLVPLGDGLFGADDAQTWVWRD